MTTKSSVKKETRANLTFLAIFLAISLPGAVILFKKKLDPSLRPSYLPPAAPRQIAYVDPREAPDLKRYVPPVTGRWVAEQAEARGIASVLAHDGLPVMSSGRLVQVANWAGKGAEVGITVLVWKGVEAISIDGQPVTIAAIIDIPVEVRRELTIAGFANPPKQITWGEVLLPGPVQPAPSRTLGLKFDDQSDTVTIFTN